MFRRYLFLITATATIASLAWASRQIDEFRWRGGSEERSASDQRLPETLVARRELVETLDEILSLQEEYRALHGQYTRILSRLGVVIPSSVQELYEIRVQEASAQRLLVVAVSEGRGRTEDYISVDHRYRVQANFALPVPRAERLRAHAERQLRQLLAVGSLEDYQETGLFTGYFRYELRPDSSGKKVAQARGILHPVSQLELEQDSGSLAAQKNQTVAEPWASDQGPVPPRVAAEVGVGQLARLARLTIPAEASENTSEEAYIDIDLAAQRRPAQDGEAGASDASPLIVEPLNGKGSSKD